jgi:hypothetical protein
MKLSIGIGFGIAALFALATANAADEPPAAGVPKAAAAASDNPPMVPPASPGVFTVKKSGPNSFHLVLAGHKFTNRSDIEKYLAYRTAQLTIEQKGDWFTFVESRAKGETADPPPKPDPGAPRYSFRMKYFRPGWRYKVNGSPTWTRWSPFAGAAFIAADPKTISDFEVSADIVTHKGTMDDTNPLAFEPRALSDLLINQVSPPT